MGDQDITGLPTIDYTARDFPSIKEALKTHLQNKFPTTWKDCYESQAGIAWLELVAYSYAILSFYLDYQANEGYLPTAQDRENVVRVCKLIGYALQGPQAASVECTLELVGPELVDVVIPAGTPIKSLSDLTFEFLDGATILAGQTSATAIVTQGESKSDIFNSDGSSFQRFLLTGTPVIYNSISMLVNGEEWTAVDALVYGDATSKVYQISYDVDEDGNDIAYVEFGDGVSGQIPVAGATIAVAYRIGGGIQGNIALNQINQQVFGLLDGVVPDTEVDVTVTNPDERGSGGEDRETTEHAKYWAPQWVKTNGRAVTEADFDTLATRFNDPTYGGVAYAKAALRQEIPELNTVDLYLWSRDQQGVPAAPSSGLKQAVQDYFDNNDAGAVRIISVDTVVQDGINLYMDIYVRAAALSNFARADVEAAIQQAVSDLFKSVNIQPGREFKLAHLYRAVQKATGVDYGLIDWIKAGILQEKIIATGDDVTMAFSGTFDVLPLLEGTIVVKAGSQILTDDGEGNLTGSGIGTADYETGAVSVTFASPVSSAYNVIITGRYLKQHQRGAAELVVALTASRFRGKIEHAPVVPGTFALSDGAQVVIDDGNGGLIGDVYAGGNNTIDYETGSYDVTFASGVIVGSTISSTYAQYLNLNAGNIPTQKWELPVEGNLTVELV